MNTNDNVITVLRRKVSRFRPFMPCCASLRVITTIPPSYYITRDILILYNAIIFCNIHSELFIILSELWQIVTQFETRRGTLFFWKHLNFVLENRQDQARCWDNKTKNLDMRWVSKKWHTATFSSFSRALPLAFAPGGNTRKVRNLWVFICFDAHVVKAGIILRGCGPFAGALPLHPVGGHVPRTPDCWDCVLNPA